LVKVEAVSVNPVDVKARVGPSRARRRSRLGRGRRRRETGPDCSLFGDAVWYRQPCARHQRGISRGRRAYRGRDAGLFAAAAALPLTAITAWERRSTVLAIPSASRERGRALLIIGGAGGVGWHIQLARRLTG
jgi:NADPH:quinone reductase-like Zn-dependent oxidoreductase